MFIREIARMEQKKKKTLVAIPFIHLKNVFSKLKGIDPINIDRGSRVEKLVA